MERLKTQTPGFTEDMHAVWVLDFLDPKVFFFFFYYAFTEQCTRGQSGGLLTHVLQKPLW